MRILLAVVLVTGFVGCFTSDMGCTVVGPGPASANFLYHARGTEAQFWQLLNATGWTNVSRSDAAPDLHFNAQRTHANQRVSLSGGVFDYQGRFSTEPITGFGIYAGQANVTSDDEARALLSPLVEALDAQRPVAWGDRDSVGYSGGAKICT